MSAMPSWAVWRERRKGKKVCGVAPARLARRMDWAMWSEVQAESTAKSRASWAGPRCMLWRKVKEVGRRRVRGRRESVVTLGS